MLKVYNSRVSYRLVDPATGRRVYTAPNNRGGLYEIAIHRVGQHGGHITMLTKPLVLT